MVRGVTTVTGIQTRNLLVIFYGGGDEHNLRSVLTKERLQIKMLEVALVTAVYSTSTVTVFVFLPLGSRRLTNIRERVCKVCRRCQTVMASFPSSLATGRFSFMVTLLDNKSGASVTPL